MLPDTLEAQLGDRRVHVDHPSNSTQLDLADALAVARNQPRWLRRKQAAARVIAYSGLQLVLPSGQPFGPSLRSSRQNQFVSRRSRRLA